LSKIAAESAGGVEVGEPLAKTALNRRDSSIAIYAGAVGIIQRKSVEKRGTF
jgi:hypothetical protein